MSRNVPAPLQVILDSGALRPAILVKITLRSGTVYRHTSWDQMIDYDGVSYLPNEGISLSAISSSVGTTVDNSEVSGSATDSRLDEDDFDRGAWRMARYMVMLVDMGDITAGHVILQSGLIGQVSVTDGKVQGELFGLASFLKGQSGYLSSKECTCSRVGDGRCGLDLSGTVASGAHAGKAMRHVAAVVSAVTSREAFVFGSDSAANDFYSGGYLEFTSGANIGERLEIKQHTKVGSTASLTLRLPAPYDVEIGDEATLVVGCNRKLKYDDVSEPVYGCTCQELNNVLNFKGQHYLPGNDKIAEVARVNS